MKRMSIALLAIGLALIFSMNAWAQETPAEKASDLRALVEAGVVMAVKQGGEAALKAIGDPKGPFISGELYLFAGPVDKVTLSAHPYKPELVGKDLATYRGPRGNFIFFDFVKVCLTTGAGWTRYWWPKPGATKPSAKLTFVMKVPGQNLYVAGGLYPTP